MRHVGPGTSLIVLACCLLASCTMIQRMSPSHREAQERADKVQVLQLSVMRYADDYRGRIVEVMNRFQAEARTPEERLNAQTWKLQQAESAYLIASGPNPITNALDMVVLASLSRMVLDDLWISELYGERARPVQEAHRTLEAQAWTLVEGVLTPAQINELREFIVLWREQNPNVRAVSSMHFVDFAKAAGSPRPGEEPKVGSIFSLLRLDPFSSLDPAVVELALTRQLAERSIFYLQRMPGLLSMQVERLTDQLVMMQESKDLLASIDRISLAGSAADRLVTTLPTIIATERNALLAQLFAELNAQSTSLDALSGNMRATLEAGTQTAAALNETLETLDRISARYAPTGETHASKEAARPFDVREYTATLSELTAATRELNTLTQNLDAALPAVRAATQSVTSDVERIVDRAFMLALVLVLVTIVGTLVATLSYRAIVKRRPAEN